MTIRELRGRTGLSQSRFSQRFHLQVGTLRTWEQGVRNCPEPVLYMIGRILDLEEQLKEAERSEEAGRD